MMQAQFGPKITDGVKSLIIVNVVFFILQLIFDGSLLLGGSRGQSQLNIFLAITPSLILKGYIWQIFTYQFLHGGFMHILFNMLALWMFGSELEMQWGKKEFIKYYLISGTGAGLVIFLIPTIFNQPSVTTLGASGAIFGLLLAYAIYWPDRKILFMLIFPIKVKYFVLGIGLISLFFTFGAGGGSISHIGHLGGLLSGYLYLIYRIKYHGKSSSTHTSNQFKQKWNIIHRLKVYKQKKMWEKTQKNNFEMSHMEDKIDLLLDKISKYGMKSLSGEEKRFLRRASQNMSDKNNNSTKH